MSLRVGPTGSVSPTHASSRSRLSSPRPPWRRGRRHRTATRRRGTDLRFTLRVRAARAGPRGQAHEARARMPGPRPTSHLKQGVSLKRLRARLGQVTGNVPVTGASRPNDAVITKALHRLPHLRANVPIGLGASDRVRVLLHARVQRIQRSGTAREWNEALKHDAAPRLPRCSARGGAGLRVLRHRGEVRE